MPAEAPAQWQAKGSTCAGWYAETETLPEVGGSACSLKRHEKVRGLTELGIRTPDTDMFPVKSSLGQQIPPNLLMNMPMRKAGFFFEASRGTTLEAIAVMQSAQRQGP